MRDSRQVKETEADSLVFLYLSLSSFLSVCFIAAASRLVLSIQVYWSCLIARSLHLVISVTCHSYPTPLKKPLPSPTLATFIRCLFARRSSSPLPLPTRPRHAEIPEATGSGPQQSLQSSSPSSYFTASEHQSQRSSPAPSSSNTRAESIVSETETLEVFQAHRDDEEPIEEDPIDPIQALENAGAQRIIDNIYHNPLFYDLLVARFHLWKHSRSVERVAHCVSQSRTPAAR